MHDAKTGHTPDSALTELRKRLDSGLAKTGCTKVQLVARTDLSRTTVQEAFRPDGPVPSAQTVAALARALRLPGEELLALQRGAAGDGGGERSGPGRPIEQWEPHALEVHPAGSAPEGSGSLEQRALPGYVLREHDRLLAEAVREAGQGCSRMVVLVGESSTGKTRACWEAVQPLGEMGWRLWHPFDPTRAEAALEELHRVGPRTVVWLNEAQHYFGDRAGGERVAAAVHALLVHPERGPVLVLGTLWPDYFKQYAALPAAGVEDPHSRVRELLAGRTVSVPDVFGASDLAAATVLAEGGDRLLADALTRARTDGHLAQDLAGGPALLECYRTASPAGKALLEVAMDARRLGVNLHLPQAFLTDAAPDYLRDSDWDQLTDDWAEKAYAALAEQVHGKRAPLRRANPRPQRRLPGLSAPADASAPRLVGPVFRLADYLEQHGSTTRRHRCPPTSFWHAAHTHLTHPGDLDSLAQAAEGRHRLQWAHHLYQRAIEYGSANALVRLAAMREEAGDRDGAESLLWRAADHGDTNALVRLAGMRKESGDRDGAETLYGRAADHGSTRALARLASMRKEVGDRNGTETLYRQAADLGDTYALVQLARLRDEAGDRDGAESLLWRAADHGNTGALYHLAGMREKAGDRGSAETLAQRAAGYGYTRVLVRLARMREKAGDRESAEALAQQAADHGNTYALVQLAEMREEAGDRNSAETLRQRAADHGDTDALVQLVAMRERAGDREGAEALAQQAADHGNTDALVQLAGIREEAADWTSAETLYRRAADHGSTDALVDLARMRERAGDREGAEALAQQAADHGNTDALVELAGIREEAGDRTSAEAFARRAADHGHADTLIRLVRMREVLTRLWPYGLDPDGTPTPEWQ